MKNSKPRSKPRPNATLWLFAILAVVLFSLGMVELRASAKFGPLIYLSRRIETAAKVTPESIDRQTGLVGEIIDGHYCRSDILRAGLVVTLARLDRRNSFSDYESWAAAMQAADRFLVHAIGCTPSDGNLWLRLAMIRWAIAEKPEELAFLMTQSADLAPAEESVLEARFIVWAKASKETLELAKRALERDLQTLITYGKATAMARVANGAGDNLAPYVRDALKQIPAERRDVLRKAGLDPKYG